MTSAPEAVTQGNSQGSGDGPQPWLPVVCKSATLSRPLPGRERLAYTDAL